MAKTFSIFFILSKIIESFIYDWYDGNIAIELFWLWLWSWVHFGCDWGDEHAVIMADVMDVQLGYKGDTKNQFACVKSFEN